MINKILTLSIATCLLSLPTAIMAKPITEAQDMIELKLLDHDIGDNPKVTAARFVISGYQQQYSLNTIHTSGLLGDYNIKDLSISGRNSFSATLSSDNNIIKMQGQFDNYIEIPVLANIVNKGDIISQSDIKWLETSSNRLRQSIFSDASQMVGKQAVRRININRPVRLRDLTKPIIVKKNANISIVYNSKYMNLRTTGTTLMSASVGEVIKIKNLKSGTIIQAMVTNNGEAIVNYQQLLLQNTINEKG